jgi:hypothetical protein
MLFWIWIRPFKSVSTRVDFPHFPTYFRLTFDLLPTYFRLTFRLSFDLLSDLLPTYFPTYFRLAFRLSFETSFRPTAAQHAVARFGEELLHQLVTVQRQLAHQQHLVAFPRSSARTAAARASARGGPPPVARGSSRSTVAPCSCISLAAADSATSACVAIKSHSSTAAQPASGPPGLGSSGRQPAAGRSARGSSAAAGRPWQPSRKMASVCSPLCGARERTPWAKLPPSSYGSAARWLMSGMPGGAATTVALNAATAASGTDPRRCAWCCFPGASRCERPQREQVAALGEDEVVLAHLARVRTGAAARALGP